MAKKHDHRSKGPHRGRGDYEGHEREPYDDPEEHREIERLRFRGSLPATPELYARGREQWYRLPGAVVRSPMDPVISDPPSGEKHPPAPGHPDGK